MKNADTLIFVCVILALSSVVSAGERNPITPLTWGDPKVGHETYFTWDVDTLKPNVGVVDLSGTLDAPAGSHGVLQTRGEEFVFADGTPVRLWGTNMLYQAPPKSEAPRVAARLASLGYNVIRMHHIDRGNGGGLFDSPEKNLDAPIDDPWKFDPQRLDDFFYFISELKKRGIYVSLGLISYREIYTKDWMPPYRERRHPYPIIVSDPQKNYHQAYNQYLPEMEAAYKQYVRKLLTTVNPYTHLPLAKDPCVALYDISNENGMIRSWNFHESMPTRARDVLNAKWKQWLKKRYTTDEAFRAAWKTPEAVHQKTLDEKTSRFLQNADLTEEMKFWQVDGATMKLANWSDVEGARNVPVLAVTPKDTKAVVFQRFESRLDSEKKFQLAMVGYTNQDNAAVTVQLQEWTGKAWEGLSNPKILTLSDHAEYYQADLTTQQKTKGWHPKLRLAFTIAAKGKTVYLGDVSFCEKTSNGLLPGEGLDNPPSTVLEVLDARGKVAEIDGLEFRNELARDHYRRMRDFLRNELSVRNPIIGTQDILKSDWFTNVDMDVSDIHGYANFKESGLEGGWTILHKCASPQGKPRNISEYNSFGTRAPVEKMILPPLAAARQGYAGMQLFTYTHDFQTHILHSRHLNTRHNASAWVGGLVGWAIFARGDVAPAEKEIFFEVSLKGFSKRLADSPGYNPDQAYRELHAKYGITPIHFLMERVRVRLGDKDQLIQPPVNDDGKVFHSPNGQLAWDRSQPGKPLLTVTTPRTCGAIGALGGRTVTAGRLTMTMEKNELDYQAVFAVAMDDKPLTESRSIVIVALGNQKTQLPEEGYRDRPALIEGLAGSIRMQHAFRGVCIYALDPYGRRKEQVTSKEAPDGFELTLSPKYKTLWYEVSFENPTPD